MEANEKKVLSLIDEERDSLVEFVRDLVRFNTTTPNPGEPPVQEKECQTYIAKRLAKVGFQVDSWEPDTAPLKKYPFYIDGQNFRDRPIVVGRLKSDGDGRSLLFNGHIDVVPADPIKEWSYEPFGATVASGRIYGRGSCDMKAGIASMIAAVEFLKKAGVPLKGDVLVETVTDEEINGLGTAACIEKGYRADAAIDPEPTDLDIWIATRGVLWCRLDVYGRAGHAEMKHPHWSKGGAVSAIEKTVLILKALRDLEIEWLDRPDKKHPLLSTPRILPTMIRGGEFWESYPQRCQVEIDIQYLPTERDEQGYGSLVKQEIETHIRNAAALDPWLNQHPPGVSWLMDYGPMEMQPDHPIVQQLMDSARSIGLDPKLTGLDSFDDAAHLVNIAKIPGASFGPGNLIHAHAADEFVPIEAIVKSTKALALSVMRWCGQA